MGSKSNGNKKEFSKIFKFSSFSNQSNDLFIKTEDNMIECKDKHIVKSISERVIDDFFFEKNIRHIYEKKILGMSCDWYLIDFDIYIEFVGLNNQKYASKMEKKIKRYSQFGLRVIKIYDYHLSNLQSILDLLEKFGRRYINEV